MANLKSSIKDVRRTRRRTARRQARLSEIASAMRAVRAATTPEAATAAYRRAASLLDRAAGAGLIHWRNAARKKSRLAAAAGKVAPAPKK